MGNPLHLTITINLADGREIHDIETKCSDVADMPRAIDEVLAEHRAEVFSSLVVVVVPKAAG